MDLVWLRREEAEALRKRLEMPGARWSVSRIESKQQRRKAPVPFITSTLQQEANRKLSLSRCAYMCTHTYKVYI